MLNKLLVIVNEVIIIAFIVSVLDIAWYRAYWLTILSHIVLVIPYAALYFPNFTTTDQSLNLIIKPISFRELPLYLAILLFSILLGVSLCFSGRLFRKLEKIHHISKWIWITIYLGWSYVVLSSYKNYHHMNDRVSSEIEGMDNSNQLILALLAILIIMYISVIYTDKKILKLENMLLKEQNEMQYSSYLAMQQQETEIHKLYHDIGNHINTIQVLVSNGENQEANLYTKNLLEQYQSIRRDYYCNQKIINAVLSQKLKVCDQYGITYEVNIKLPEVISVRDIDLMSIFSNLLDNAIEGCYRNKEGSNYINLSCSIIGNYFAVKVINSKRKHSLSKDKNGYVTWKKNKKIHGYGLRIIDEIVERYQGQKELLDQGEEFSAMVMLTIN